MILTLPDFLEKHNYQKAKLTYKWNKSNDAKVENKDHSKLLAAVKLINQKAAFGLAIACSEWVLWKICNHKDNTINRPIEYYFRFTEAHWLTLLDKSYLSTWNLRENYLNYSGKIEMPLWYLDDYFISLRLFYKKIVPEFING